MVPDPSWRCDFALSDTPCVYRLCTVCILRAGWLREHIPIQCVSSARASTWFNVFASQYIASSRCCQPNCQLSGPAAHTNHCCYGSRAPCQTGQTPPGTPPLLLKSTVHSRRRIDIGDTMKSHTTAYDCSIRSQHTIAAYDCTMKSHTMAAQTSSHAPARQRAIQSVRSSEALTDAHRHAGPCQLLTSEVSLPRVKVGPPPLPCEIRHLTPGLPL